MIDLLVAVSLLCLLTGIALPGVMGVIARTRGLAAAQYLAGRAALARTRAVSRSAVVALHFQPGPRGTAFSMVEDGNRNGVRAAEIAAGIDAVVEAPVRLSDLYPGVQIADGPDAPEPGSVRLGGTRILSFTPRGTATSGSIYVVGADGTQWAVRVLGSTGRTRVLRRDATTQQWVHAF